LQVAEDNVRSYRERGTATRATGGGKPGKETLDSIDTVGDGTAGEHGGPDLFRESWF
jgi:hypothetical protein